MERAICPCDKLSHIVTAYSLDHFRGWGRGEGVGANASYTESLYPNKCIGWDTERGFDCLDLSVGSLHLYDFIALPILGKDICMIINLGWGA